MIKNLILIACFALAVFKTSAQTLPQVIPPQPEAAAYLRYGEIPVDYSTGVPRIEVPVYELTSRKLGFPITLSYHASGIKVNDLATPVGLGWVLNAGGIITRTVLDKRDEFTQKANFKTMSDFETARDNWFAQPFSHTTLGALGALLEQDNGVSSLDKQSDRFYYQLPDGKSGSFRFDFLTGALVKIPHTPVKIVKTQQSQFPYRIDGFTVTDENGTQYNFSVREFFETINREYADSWFLASMISADKTDTISFTYKNFRNSYSHVSYHQTISWTVGITGCGGGGHVGPIDPNTTSSLNGLFEPSAGIPLLDKITSANAVVSFDYASDRMDGPLYRVSQISVTDRQTGLLKKKVALKHSHFGSAINNNQRLRLDSIIYDVDQPERSAYGFRYNGIELPPYAYKLTSPNPIYFEDYWGYFNNAGNTQLAMVPLQFLLPGESNVYKGNREPELVDYYAKACMLEEIHFPTGGKNIFEFERARIPYVYSFTNDVKAVGGFRIRSITSYDAGAAASKKTYTYTHPVISSFLLNKEQFTLNNTTLTAINCGGVLSRMTSSAFSSPMHDLGPVCYESVLEYTGDDQENNTGAMLYAYLVPVINLDDGYHYGEFEHPVYVNNYHWDRSRAPLLESITEFRRDGSLFKKVKKEKNTYSLFRSANVNHGGVHVVRKWSYTNNTPTDFYAPCSPELSIPEDCLDYFSIYHYLRSFQYFDTKIYDEVQLVTQKEIIDYDVSETPRLTKTISYTYANTDHLQVTSEALTNSKGEVITTEYKYPVDFAPADPYDKMVARNIIAPVVEQRQLNGVNLLQSVKTNFSTWNGVNIIQPQTIDVKKGTGSPLTRIRYAGYDAFGNVTSVSKENDIGLRYLYNSRGTRPVAEIKNSTPTDVIVFSSFEEGTTGGWTGTGSIAADGTSPTGKNCFVLGSLYRGGLNSSSVYILSYMYKPGATVSVSGITSSDIISVMGKDGWTMVTRKITGSSHFLISGSGMIDEVRLYPVGAQMTTFTYDTLVGMTSATDTNNTTVYYEYDAAGRLQVVKDSKGNIVSTNVYHLQK